jgi:hypothetical protein
MTASLARILFPHPGESRDPFIRVTGLPMKHPYLDNDGSRLAPG